MEWLQAFMVAGATIGACWYMHRENIKMHQEFSREFSSEMKNFHGRLCTLEERYIQMMQRILEKRE